MRQLGEMQRCNSILRFNANCVIHTLIDSFVFFSFSLYLSLLKIDIAQCVISYSNATEEESPGFLYAAIIKLHTGEAICLLSLPKDIGVSYNTNIMLHERQRCLFYLLHTTIKRGKKHEGKK